MSYTTEREAFIARIAREATCNYFDAIPHARAILRDATTHHRYAEAECSEEMTDARAAWVERRSAACEHRITERCAALGFPAPMFSGDPRGCTVKIRLPSGYSDSWGGEGFCVPTRN